MTNRYFEEEFQEFLSPFLTIPLSFFDLAAKYVDKVSIYLINPEFISSRHQGRKWHKN